jgi:hypothetical protein
MRLLVGEDWEMLRFLFLLLCACLGGCGAFEFFPNSTGVGIPSSANVRDYAIETVAGATYEAKRGVTSRMSAGAYIIASVAHTNERCHKFFEALEKFKQDSEIIDKILTAGVAAGSPLLDPRLRGRNSAVHESNVPGQSAE